MSKARILSMILFCLGLRAEAALETRWWSLSTGAEATRHHDQDPVMFQDATGRSGSVFASAGAGNRWMMMGGVTDLRLEQDWWDYRGITRMGVARVALTPALGLEALGYSATGFQDTRYGSSATLPDSILHAGSTAWGAGLGITWCPTPLDPLVESVHVNMLRVRSADNGAGRQGLWSGECQLSRTEQWGEWGTREQVGLLGNRQGSESKVAGTFRLEAWRGRLGLHARAMAGRVDSWYEAERLVVHDGGAELRGSFAAGASWQAWRGLSVEGSAGQDQNAASRSRWAFVALRWTHQIWTPLD